MRLPLMVAIVSLLSVSAQAEPIAYKFTGVLGLGSYLSSPDGTTIDLNDVAFTASGIADGLATVAWGVDEHYLRAVTTYDFGALGTFTDEDIFFSVPTELGRTVGLHAGTPHGIGFFLPIPVADAFGEFDSDYVTMDIHTGLTYFNAEGATFKMSSGIGMDERVTFSHVSIQPVPEPASLSLLAIGVSCLVRCSRPNGGAL